MKPKYIALVSLVVVGTAMAGVGLVSAGHQPTNPDDFYIHQVNMTEMGPNAQICVRDRGPNLNRVRLEGLTIHTTTKFYHDGPSGKVLISVPKLRVPAPHKIVLFSNGQNPTIDAADVEGGGETCLPPGQGTSTPLFIGEYNINVGQIVTPQGAEIITGPQAFDEMPEVGQGGGGVLSSSSSSTGSQDGLSPTEPAPVETSGTSSTRPDLPADTTPKTNEPVDDTDDDTVDGTVDATDDANTVVEQVNRAVRNAIESVSGDTSTTDVTNDTITTDLANTTGTTDASNDPTGTVGESVGAGAVGLTGVLGLLGVLFGLIRHRSH